MNKTVKIILIVALVIAVIVGLYFAVKASQPQPLPSPGGPAVPPQGNQLSNIAAILGGMFKNLFGGGSGGNMANPACQQANPGFDNNGYYTTACGGVPGGGGGNCDPNNPGKDMNGFLSSQCGS